LKSYRLILKKSGLVSLSRRVDLEGVFFYNVFKTGSQSIQIYASLIQKAIGKYHYSELNPCSEGVVL